MTEPKKMTPEEQLAILKPQLLKVAPKIVAIGQMYQSAYPLDKTDAKVLDAVTVAVPLRIFMVMAASVTALITDDARAEAEALLATATNTEETK